MIEAGKLLTLTRNELATVEGATIPVDFTAQTKPRIRFKIYFINRISLLNFPNWNDHFAKNLIDCSSLDAERQILCEHSNQKIFM